MHRKTFAGVHVSKDSTDALELLRQSDAPLLVAMNHSSWWDPLLGLLVAGEVCPERAAIAPMDREMLERFGILGRVGVFGLDPDDPASLEAMVGYVGAFFEKNTGGALWLTPQGAFADPRAPIRLRPGAASVASHTPGIRVLSLAIEYAFWLDKKPQVFLHLSEAGTPDRVSIASWHRSLTHAMRNGNQRLSELVIARDPNAFTPLLASGGSGISLPYNLWLKLRGKQINLASARTAPPNPRPSDGRPA